MHRIVFPMFRRRSNQTVSDPALESKPELDSKDWQLLEALQLDARLGYAELGRKVRYELDGGDRVKIKSFKVKVEPGAVTVCVPPGATLTIR